MAIKIDWLKFLPKYWLNNYPTDWEWDHALNALLDAYEPVWDGDYCVMIGKVRVWASNYPNAFGYPYSPEWRVLPSIATRNRLKKAIGCRERNAVLSAVAKATGAA